MKPRRTILTAFFAVLVFCWSVNKLGSQTPSESTPPSQPAKADDKSNQTPADKTSTPPPTDPGSSSSPSSATPSTLPAPADKATTPAPSTAPATGEPATGEPATAEPAPVSPSGSTAGAATTGNAETGKSTATGTRDRQTPDDHSIDLNPDVQRAFPLSGNVQTPRDPNAYTLSTNTDLVLLDVSVKDSSGGYASGLTKENFKVFDNNKEQEIRYFEAGDIPVTLGLVVDNSGSMRPKRPDVVTAALAFVTASNPNDQMFVVNFNDVVRFGLPADKPFTDDRVALRDALLRNPVQGRTAMNDAVQTAMNHLRKGKYFKKAIVLVSDGGDNASELTTDELIKLAQEREVTIYTIGIYDEDDKDRNPGVLHKLAALTGGECYIPEKLAELPDVCKRIAKDIRNRYALGFVPTNVVYDGKPHALKVAVTAPNQSKLVVRARTKYIAVPPSGVLETSNKGPHKTARKQ